MGKLMRIELFNFKSYKGHQRIDFGDSYFTSIIGPNGSGKSNSMDAISFVLGIKSSQLRSASLKDLIYRGRVIRENGALNPTADGDSEDPTTAWVMAVYENDAGEEQYWKRSITVNGSSEYRINNKLVTASQYNDVLEKENILIKARNFLVFQGDVEAIASQSPKDLTRLIEQISGSLEYKAEYEKLKAEQDKAAETANFNLNRRRGINAEIKQYQEQKQEVENYEKKARERDEATVTHILWKLFHFQRNIEENKAEIERHQAELKKANQQNAKYEERLENARRDHAKAARDMGKYERAIKKRENDIQDRETSLVPVDEKINITSAQVKKIAKRIQEIKRDRDTQAAAVAEIKKQQKVVEKAQQQWEEEQRQLAAKSGAALSEADLQEYKKLRDQVSAKSAANQIKINNYKQQLKTDEEATSSLQTKVSDAESQVNNLTTEVGDLEAKRVEVKETVDSLTSEIAEKKKEYNSMTSERLRLHQKQTELEEKLQECIHKLSEVEDSFRQNRREMKMRETVATLKRIYPGVKGRVSELCKPMMKKYGDAVSTVLGRHFDAVVVENEKTAKDCIEYLRDQRLGQYTFIPLETIHAKPINSNLKGMHRGMRMAIDTIEYDPSVERAMQYACGNAVVCDDIEVAKYICYEKGVEVKAVSLDGKVIHKGGLMSGGRVQGQQGRRFEDQEVENLRKLRDNLLSQIQALPKAQRRVAQEEALQAELAGLESRLSYNRDLLKDLERNLASKKKELTHTKKQFSSLQPQLAQATASLDSLRAAINELQETVSAVQDQVFAKFCARLKYENIRVYEQRQGSLQQENAHKKLEFITQKSRLDNQLSFEEGRLQETEDRIAKLEKSGRRDETTLREQEALKKEIEEIIDTVKREIELLKDEMEGKEEELNEKAEVVARLKKEASVRNKVAHDLQKEITSLEAEMERHAAQRLNQLRKCRMEEIKIPLTDESEPLENLPIDDALAPDPDAMDVDSDSEQPNGISAAGGRNSLQDYGIQPDFSVLDDSLRLRHDAAEDMDHVEEELQEKIRNITAELERMAPNMKATDRLEGVESRLNETEREFEQSRREARAAKDRFQKVKEQRLSLFKAAFEHISTQIQTVYKDLTRSKSFPLGGTAYLDIEDSDEPYLDGIKYHAMPPMKRFRDMEHLSGGEKTMAALALLFAIHSFHPSPFFVLDEVDAALDSANVEKIATYIAERAGPGFQFVVISLKAALFQNSETLVGIYRDQVEHSSKVLTLDLRGYPKAPEA